MMGSGATALTRVPACTSACDQDSSNIEVTPSAFAVGFLCRFGTAGFQVYRPEYASR